MPLLRFSPFLCLAAATLGGGKPEREEATRMHVVNAWVPVGARTLRVDRAGVFKVGDGHIESPTAPVAPRSLYLRQLQDRLGPAAVTVVTAPTPGPAR